MTVMSALPIYVPHIERGPHPQVLEAIRAQGFTPKPVLTPQADPYSYNDQMRQWWREGRGFLIIEQDARPPDGAIREYLDCPYPVCNRPHNCRRPGVMGSLACVKFSTDLLRAEPDLADYVLAARDDELYWRWGFLNTIPYFPGCGRPGSLRTATVKQEVRDRFGAFPGPLWPTTAHWPHCDTALFRTLERRGYPMHNHEAASNCFPDPNEQIAS